MNVIVTINYRLETWGQAPDHAYEGLPWLRWTSENVYKGLYVLKIYVCYYCMCVWWVCGFMCHSVCMCVWCQRATLQSPVSLSTLVWMLEDGLRWSGSSHEVADAFNFWGVSVAHELVLIKSSSMGRLVLNVGGAVFSADHSGLY